MAWIRLAAANREIAAVRYKQGDYQGALNHFRESLRVVRNANKQSTDVQMQVAEPKYMLRVAENLYRTGQKDEALQMMREALAIHTRVNNFNQTNAQSLNRQAEFLRWSGEVYALLGRTNETLAACREAESLWKKFLEDDLQQSDTVNSELARLFIIRGNVYTRTQEARHEYQKAVEILSKLKAENKIELEDLNSLRKTQEKLQELGNS